MRIEKILLSDVLGTSRIGRPTKWFTANPLQQNIYNNYLFFKNPIGKIMRPIVEWFVKFDLKRQVMLNRQKGIPAQDILVHQQVDLRRGVLFEHMARQCLHPYYLVLKMHRRARFSKIEIAVSGFLAPEYILSEINDDCIVDGFRTKRKWFQFQHDNYSSDMTNRPHVSLTDKVNPMQLIICYGFFRPEAWDRQFMNEEYTGWCPKQVLAQTKDRKRFPYDLTIQQNKSKFEDYVVRFNQQCPGVLAPFNQQFDFKAYYAEIGV